jgi:hypothetical protein
MSQELKKPNTYDADGFADYDDNIEGGEERRSSPGTYIKFTNEALWKISREDTAMPPELELLVASVVREMVKRDRDGAIIERTTLVPGQKFPDLKGLNDNAPRAEWRDGPNGPQGPYQGQSLVLLLDPERMDKFIYGANIETIGASICVRELVEKVCWMRRFRGAKVTPIVRLASKWMTTRFGGRMRPHLEIVRWVEAGGEPAPALPPANADTKLIEQAPVANENEPKKGNVTTMTNLGKEMKDKVPW